MSKYEPMAGLSIDQAAEESTTLAKQSGQAISFDFNGVTCIAEPIKSVEENRLAFRAALGLPAKDPPFHPQTALDALARWDRGDSVFTVEMGGLSPGYEQAIHILVFELIRDNGNLPIPNGDKEWRSWGDATVKRIDEAIGGFSGAQVGAAKTLAFRAIRDGWEKMLESAPKERQIQVSKAFPHL